VTDCPCGSGVEFARCCEPFLKGALVPETAEQVMRARYTAHTRVDMAYLMATLHPGNVNEGEEESARRWAEESEWLGLEILATKDGGAGDSEGIVEFVARFRDKNGETHAHHERSTFVNEKGRWLFREGHTVGPATVRRATPRVGRNDSCPCGSGKKYKKCCEKAQAPAARPRGAGLQPKPRGKQAAEDPGPLLPPCGPARTRASSVPRLYPPADLRKSAA